MSNNASCGQNCAPDQCPNWGGAGPVSLQVALERFQREAILDHCDTGRYRLHYFEWGAGPPLVFIHGAGDINRSFVPLICRLSSQFRCIAYNLPSGHGDGARLSRYRHENLVDDLRALLDHLKLERTYLLGSSFGSTIAISAMRRQPERIARAILQGALAYRPLSWAERFFTAIFRWCPGPCSKLPRRTRILEAVHRRPFAEQPAEVWQAFVEWTGESRLAALGYQAKWLHRLDLRGELEHLRQPILLIAGDRDSVIPFSHAERLLQRLPNARLAIIEGAGHVPYYSHPDAMAAMIRHFLTPPVPGKSVQNLCEETKRKFGLPTEHIDCPNHGPNPVVEKSDLRDSSEPEQE